MDLAFDVLLMLHFGALVVGGATNIAMPLVACQMAGAAPETAQRLGPIMRTLTINARIAIGLLVLTGITMLWIRYGGDPAGLGAWFTAKMVFVVVILAAVIVGATTLRERISPAMLGITMRFALIGIVVCSVLTFH